jgi:hypothetical protein
MSAAEIRAAIERERQRRKAEMNDPYSAPNYRADQVQRADRAIEKLQHQLRIAEESEAA